MLIRPLHVNHSLTAELRNSAGYSRTFELVRVSAMSSHSTRKVCKCDIYLLICLTLELFTIVQAGIFSKRNIYIPSFKYQMCDRNVYNKKYTFWFRDLDVMATSYGDVDFTGSFVVTTNLTSPLKASVVLKRRILGMDVPIPCIKNFGSCTYDNLCKFGYSENEQCPPILEEHDVPCRCPIEPGMYNIPGLQMKEMAKSRWAGLLAGKYKASIKLYQGPRVITCYLINFTLA